MRSIGLIPSDTGRAGGRPVGQRMTHYIQEGGRFESVVKKILFTGFTLPYVERWGDAEAAKRNAKLRTKFTCPHCKANAWGKPDLKILCEPCGKRMLSEEDEVCFD
jgi:hypothetical protein